MTKRNQKGFSLLELLVVVAVFTVLTGAVFELLTVAQQRYRAESEFLDSFQSARLGIDQMTRDVHAAGFPPANSFQVPPPANSVASTPFAWSPNYQGLPPVNPGCTAPAPGAVGTCGNPNGFDLIIETTPQPGAGVQWIRYALGGPGLPATAQVPTTLYRGVTAKVAGQDPLVATNAVLVPYVENVMNNAPAAQMAAIQAAYPTMFPGNNAVPVFQYYFDPNDTNAPCAAQPALPTPQVASAPPCILEVDITLIVQSVSPDPKTGRPRVGTLTARAIRVNPRQ